MLDKLKSANEKRTSVVSTKKKDSTVRTQVKKRLVMHSPKHAQTLQSMRAHDEATQREASETVAKKEERCNDVVDYDYFGNERKASSRLKAWFWIVALLFSCVAVVAASYGAHYGKINVQFLEEVYTRSEVMREYIVTSYAHFTSDVNDMVSDTTEVIDEPFFKVSDFNDERVLNSIGIPEGAQAEMVSHLIDGKGDMAVHVSYEGNRQTNRAQEIVLKLPNITLQQYSEIECMLKGRTTSREPMLITLVLYSGIEKVYSTSFIINESWKRFALGFSEFEGIDKFSFISRLSFLVEPINSTDDKGWDMWIDDVYLVKG